MAMALANKFTHNFKLNSNSIFDSKFASTYTSSDIENIFAEKEAFRVNISQEDIENLKTAFIESHDHEFNSHQDYMKFMNMYTRNKFSKTALLKIYRQLLKQNEITRNLNIERYMKLKSTKGNSGILQITTMMAGQMFGDENNIKNGGCPHKCTFCPLEIIDGIITQPHSYLTLEPANQRATQNKHHPLGQIFDRLNVFEKMGHLSPTPDTPAKIEFMISGGTFNFFPKDYIEWFTTMSFYAMNVYYDYILTGKFRDVMSLEEEQKINESAPIRMIGFTIETRPDYLSVDIVRFFRELGITRVQTGCQHVDNYILKISKRDCTNEENQEGNIILMQNGFKVDNHWMLALQETTAEMDLKMIEEIFSNPNYAVDQTKLYPTTVTPYSELHEMYQRGDYVPYYELDGGKENIQKVIETYLEKVPYYMRVNRVVRDFYSDVVVAGVESDMRNVAEKSLLEKGVILKDIRLREVKNADFNEEDCKMFIEKYEACAGTNYFISFENNYRTKLYGFIRLRFNKSEKYVLSELINCALIRELHVYGQHTGVGDKENKQTQHRGLGKKLVAKAEEIAALNGYEKIVVISGIGVKDYYRKLGYSDYHTYLAKDIDLPMRYHYMIFTLAIIFFAIIVAMINYFN